MFCKNCGAQLKEDAKFCGSCGAPVAQAAPVAEPVVEQAAPVVEPVVEQAAVADPFAGQMNQAPVADPFAGQMNQEPVADPFAGQMNQAPVADPFAGQMNQEPVADPFAGQMNQAPVADPFAGQMNQAPVADPFAGQMNNGFAQQTPMTSKKKSKLPLILGLSIGLLVAIIATIVILLFACSGGGASSPDEACKMAFDAINEQDLGDLEDILYPTIVKSGEYFDREIYTKDETLQYYTSLLNPSEDEKKPKFSDVKVEKKEKMDTSDIKTLISRYSEEKGFEKFSSVVNITGTVKIKVDGEKNKYNFNAVVCNVDGDWYVMSINVNKYMKYYDED